MNTETESEESAEGDRASVVEVGWGQKEQGRTVTLAKKLSSSYH